MALVIDLAPVNDTILLCIILYCKTKKQIHSSL